MNCLLIGLKIRLACRDEVINCSQTKASLVAVWYFPAITVTCLNTVVGRADILVPGTTGTGNSSSIAEVRVDANKIRSHAASTDTLKHNMAWAPSLIVGAIAATPVQLSRVGDNVVADSHTSTAVGLDNFVSCASGATVLDKNIARSKCSNGVYKC